MLLFLHGEEKFLILERLIVLKEAFRGKNTQALIKEFDFGSGDKIGIEELKSHLSSGGGLFSSSKMLILRNLFSFEVKKQKDLADFLKQRNIADDKELVVVIVGGAKKEMKGSLFNFLKKVGKEEEYKKMDEKEVIKWIIKKAKEKSGGRVGIEEAAAIFLTKTNKSDLWKIEKELDKMVNFKDEGNLTLEEVREVCGGTEEVKIFSLMDAIGEDNKKKALEIRSKLSLQGVNEFLIFSMIVSQLKNLAKVKILQEKGFFGQNLAKEGGIHPFVAEKTTRQLFSFSKERIKKAFALAVEIDKKAKSGGGQMKELLDYFILKI